MSFNVILDEIPEARIKQELIQREGTRKLGRCDYCGQLPTAPTCQFPDRHHDPRIAGYKPPKKKEF